MTTHTITLPYTKPPLTANQRHHWATRARITRELRHTTHTLTRATLGPNPTPQTHIHLHLHYQPRDNRHRDTDNLVPTLKAIADGITDTGIIPDDTPQYITKYMPTIHPPQPGQPGKLWYTITIEDKPRPTKTTATQILDAIRAKYPRLALVPELTINDLWAQEQPGEATVYQRRIDALLFDGQQRTAIEIKISKADARRETWHKTAPWRNVCHRFIYVTTPDIDFTDIGEPGQPANWECGHWVVHHDGHIEVKRKAKINKYPEPLPGDVITRLAYRAHQLATTKATE